MKRVRILALVLVVAIMLVGSAYALWGEDITITTTATMGEMDVDIQCGPAIYPLSCMPGLPADMWDGVMEDYMNPITGSITGEGQTIQVTVGDLYPGAKYGLSFAIKNTGTVPFNLTDMDIVFAGGNGDLFNRLSGAFQFKYIPFATGWFTQDVSVPMTAFAGGALEAAIVAACDDIILYPGDEFIGGWVPVNQDDASIAMQVLVDEGITGDQFENAITSFNIVFNWEQCDPVQF